MAFVRYSRNPMLSPNPHNAWENYATFNGSVVKNNGTYFLVYRAMGEEVHIEKQTLRLSVIGCAQSSDGYVFEDRSLLISPQEEWEKYGCEDPRVTCIDDRFVIFYTALSSFPPSHKHIKVAVALSKDLQTIEERHLVTPFNAKAMVLFPEKINGLYTVLLTVNTDNPPTHIACAQVADLNTLWSLDFWNDWYQNLDQHTLPSRRLSSDGIEIGAPPIKTSAGWVLMYSYIKHYFNTSLEKEFRIEAVLLDLQDPKKIIGRIEKPLLVPEEPYEKEGVITNIVFPSGGLIEDNMIKLYYGAADTHCAEAEESLNEFMNSFETQTPVALKCQRFHNNPLLQPIPEHSWENTAVFNPAACEIEGKVYIIYRAMSDTFVSQLGMAVSDDGMFVDERLRAPIYSPRADFEKPRTPDGPGGCEDPRITQIGNTIYMLYTAYDGVLPRLAITSMSVSDFIKREWTAWTYPVVISQPQTADKDGMLFPEKINGKYVLFHRVEPNICIDYLDNLDFSTGKFLETHHIITPHDKTWDEKKIGINTPPIKTQDGWIVFYHGISTIDGYYRIAAMLLDLEDVTRVISRTHYPILDPLEPFERVGLVNNVVFPCGFVVKGDTVYLYYGAADRVVCGATISLTSLLDYLKRSITRKYLTFIK